MFKNFKTLTSKINCKNNSKQKNNFIKTKKKVELKTLPVFKYSLCKKSNTRVYAWGLQEHGALGTVKKLSFAKEDVAFSGYPHRLSFGEFNNVSDIACGYGFTIFAVKLKSRILIFGTGINSDSQLGYNVIDEKLKIPIVKYPRTMYLPLKKKTTNILGLAAGRAHSLILTDEGLYTLGNNCYGQCGRPIINNEDYLLSKVVHYIPNIKGKKISSVTAGQDHSMLLTESGEVYTCGWGADGQTGLAHYRNEYKPSLVEGDMADHKIIKLACTADCVLALSDSGKLFGWGNSEYSQLNVKTDHQQINIASEIKSSQMGHIVDIACGGSFCMALNDDGQVYVWGFGILGLGPKVQKVLKPTPIPKTLFGYNAYEPDAKVTNIFSGVNQLGAITNLGHLYMWGLNKFGSLGLGHCKDQFFPLKVPLAARVNKISCGVDHVVSICKPFI